MSHSHRPPGPPAVRSLRIRYLLLTDLLLIWLAVFLAILARVESFSALRSYLADGGWVLLVLASAVRIPLYRAANLYNRLWRYASTNELNGILRVSLIAPLLIALLNFGLLRVLGTPYSHSGSIWLLEGVFSLCMLAGLRFALRHAQERRRHKPTADAVIPTLIVGAGDAGAIILRDLQRNPGLGLQVVGLVDDDPTKHHNELHGVPVLGSHEELSELIRHHGIRQVIIAMPTAPGKVIREIVQTCEEANIIPRIVPRLESWITGPPLLNQLRPVDIEDLLRREPIVTDTEGIHALLHGRCVLITGGGGSIGSELCRQILRCRPAQLVILGHGENSVFEIEQELGHLAGRLQSTTYISTAIADIRMPERVQSVFQHYRPHVVFHAAAHKHVPLMETNPVEAITNNILGTRNVLQAAEAVQVDRFIMISSDKAVNPTNVMGATKRAAELLVLDTARRTGKPYVAVRFGNVLGSRGSVLHTFRRQIAHGGPITITHRDVRRFFMTIPEAVQLLLQAAILGQGGEVFMLDMGEPVRIVDLATDLIRLSGFEVERDIDIIFTGLRPGEKLYEELFLPGEIYHTTAHPKIRIAAGAARFVPDHLHNTVSELAASAAQIEPDLLLHHLRRLVPEYRTASEPPASVPRCGAGSRGSVAIRTQTEGGTAG